MSDLVMQLAGVIQRDIDTLTAVSQNVANANTPGYKSSRAFSVFSASLPNSGVTQSLEAVQTYTTVVADGGALQTTGRTTDLAISGDAWFALQTEQGLMLTRDGRFRVDSAGYLVSDAGDPVMGEDGPIQVAGGVLKVDTAGVVSLDDRRVGQISLVQAGHAAGITAAGDGLYGTDGSWRPAKGYAVHQGMLERSNAALGDDMVKMMEVTRHVESMQRALSAYDGMLDSGINQLGKD